MKKLPEISAASIIAKVERDRLMKKMSFLLKNTAGIIMQVMEPRIILKLLKNLE